MMILLYHVFCKMQWKFVNILLLFADNRLEIKGAEEKFHERIIAGSKRIGAAGEPRGHDDAARRAVFAEKGSAT